MQLGLINFNMNTIYKATDNMIKVLSMYKNAKTINDIS